MTFLSLAGTAGNAFAACTGTAGTDAGGATLTFTSIGQTISICFNPATGDHAEWGLYPALNVESNFNAPIGNTTGTVDSPAYFAYADYTYTTSKAVYVLHPVQGSSNSGHEEIQVTLQSKTGSGTDSMTLYSSSYCTESASGCPSGPQATRLDGNKFFSGPTDTPFTISIASLPAAPTVTGVSPTSGPTGGTNSVTITGTGFLGTTGAGGVKFGGTNATSYTVNSATQIAAVAPSGTGTVDIRVTTGGQTSGATAADQYTYVAAPTVTAVAPTSGPVAGGTAVTITGSGFLAAASTGAVKFGGTTATYTINTDSSIAATSPAGSLGAVDVTVTTPGGTSATSAADRFTYVAVPTATTAVANASLTQGRAATPFTPVTGSGGTGALTYSVSPTLPSGLSYNTSNGQITGTPSVTSASTAYTVTVTDTNSLTATASFNLTINPAVTATQAVASIALTRGKTATPVTPVTGGGGTAPLGYGISPTLPAGLNFDTTTGAISGTPTATSLAATYTVTVNDVNGASAANTFSLTVNPAVTATQSVPSTTLTANGPAASFTPVTGSGGTGSLTYGISPSLPSGLTLSASSGQISGTPTAASSVTTYTVTVTDVNAASASNTFVLTVNSAVVATQAVPVTALTVNTAAVPFTPVTGSGGTGALTYAVSPGLPAGLSFSTGNGQVTGTPAAVSAAGNYTVTVTDTLGASTSNTFSLAVNSAVTATQAIATTALTQNKAVTSFTPVIGSGGTTPLTYAITPGLPAGLSFNTSSGAITGTPTVTSSAMTYTVTVSDVNAASASNTFSLAVNAAVTATQAIASRTITAGAPATPFTPVTGSGGTGALSYGISPSLPSGLSINPSNGAISGTPTAASPAGTYTVTVTDTNAATATNTFSLTVNGAVTATQTVAAKTLTMNTAATPFTPVTGAGGTGALTYAVSPGLPAGLTLSTSTGLVTGTPTVSGLAATYTVTVTDSLGAAASNTFSLTVNSAVTATQSVPSVTLTQNKAVTPVIPVTGGGGTAPLTYGVAPNLPAGLTYSATTGAITGTPTATSVASTYTVTVTDTNGATATNTFSLTVNSAVTATTAVPSTTLTANLAATPFTPVTGGGGTGALTYSVSPTLPAGLTLNAVTGQVTGTPTAAAAAASYTVTVTDINSAAATATFSLTVNGPVIATTAVPTTTLVLNSPATPFTPVIGSGGTPPLVYAVAPALPAGLNFSTASGAISGTPTTPLPPATFTVTVTDSLGATASATFSLAVGQIATTVALASSLNPSQAGQPVTFTATVAGAGGPPTGNVIFNDNGTAIGTAPLSGGVASLTISTLTVGAHAITAVYGGNAIFLASTSPALTQTVNIPADSVKLRALQVTVSKLVAQNSGQAISGAIDTAITEGFSDGGGQFMTPSGTGMRFNFSADEQPDSDAKTTGDKTANAYNGGAPASGRSGARGGARIGDAFAALDKPATKAPPLKFREHKEWMFWADVRGSGMDRWSGAPTNVGTPTTEANVFGSQLNLTAGLTYKPSANFLIGVLGGYETFSYTEQDINGRLKGEGWTTGAYAGWKIVPTLRWDAAVAYSGIGYNGVAGTAVGNFSGNRWLASTGLTGTYQFESGLVIEPSAKVYALWEHQNAYTDSLGTLQTARNFSTGRASAGVKFAYTLGWWQSVQIMPFVGAYGDYYFTQDNTPAIALAGGVPLASVPLVEGWSARVTGGVGARFDGGMMLSIGGELGGLGSNTQIWTVTGRARLPFSAQ